MTKWTAATDKLDDLCRRLPAEYGDRGWTGLCDFVVGREPNAGISAASFRRSLNKCREHLHPCGAGDLPQSNIRLLMRVFGVPEQEFSRFTQCIIGDFTDTMDHYMPVGQLAARASLRLFPEHPENVWNKEFQFDVAPPAQGDPMGLVIEVSGRHIHHKRTKWAYGFRRISVVLEPIGANRARFEIDPKLSIGYKTNTLEVSLRGVATRLDVEIATLDESAMNERFVSEKLATLRGAVLDDKVSAQLRVLRHESSVAYVGTGQPPSSTKREIINCIFGQSLPAGEGDDDQFVTLATQILTVEPDDWQEPND